jgi:hypothetical protein
MVMSVVTADWDQGTGSLKEELGLIAPELAEMRRKREERRRQFADVTQRVNRMQEEMNLLVGQPNARAAAVVVDGSDLTTTKLDELRAYLHHLQQEKVIHLIRPFFFLEHDFTCISLRRKKFDSSTAKRTERTTPSEMPGR